MKKIIMLTMICTFVFGILPNQFTVSEKFFSIGDDFSIKVDREEIGTIEEKIISWGKTFVLYIDKQKIATAKQRVLSWGTKIDIYDNNDKKIGVVKEIVLKSLLKVVNTYEIYDGNDNKLGNSLKEEFLDTKIKIYNTKGHLVATIYRPMINIVTDDWTVATTGELDKRLIVFIAAYKTSSDNSKKED